MCQISPFLLKNSTPQAARDSYDKANVLNSAQVAGVHENMHSDCTWFFSGTSATSFARAVQVLGLRLVFFSPAM